MKPVAKMVGRIVEKEKEKEMNSKSISKRLKKLGYTLGRDIFGWIVISDYTGWEWKFPTLGGVNRFITDEEALTTYNGGCAK